MAQSFGRPATWRLGTRGSPLALTQAQAVRGRLASAHGLSPEAIEICVIRTSGDRIQDRPLVEFGGKGLFTKEIEEALHAGTIDLAVHSAKDMPTMLPQGLLVGACLEREDVRDAFISRKAKSLQDLPPAAVVGTASPRREAMVKRLRPDLRVVSLRGNVETRLRKLEEGQVDATILAMAGLKRLGLTDAATSMLAIEDFIPAAGQGAIGIEIRSEDTRTYDFIAAIDHPDTSIAIAAERAFLAVLDGTCRTPIAGHARLIDDLVNFHGIILKPDGSVVHETSRTGPRAQAIALAKDAGHELKARAGADFFAAE